MKTSKRRTNILVYIMLFLAKAQRGAEKAPSVEEAQQGVTAKQPK